PRQLSHVEILNLLARTSGFRNYQHMRASALAGERLAEPAPAAPPEPPVDQTRVAKALRLFDDAGRLTRWPPKANQRELCLWALWAVLP
ncbi:hypothetical protein J8J27_28680, partial [Mycobacterium tuberculosis]|nr:hypothetical protein [Mycobacterium tuberculosis]